MVEDNPFPYPCLPHPNLTRPPNWPPHLCWCLNLLGHWDLLQNPMGCMADLSLPERPLPWHQLAWRCFPQAHHLCPRRKRLLQQPNPCTLWQPRGHDKGRSHNFEVNLSIHCSASVLTACNLSLCLNYIESEENPADPILCGIMGPATEHLFSTFTLPEELKPYLLHV